MKLLCFLCVLIQLWIVQGRYNRTWPVDKHGIVVVPRTTQPSLVLETPLWFYLPIPIGVMALLVVFCVLYRNRKHRGALRRRRRAEQPTTNISVPVPGTVTSLMGNASVDIISLTPCTLGKPQLKSKMLHTFNDHERMRNSFETEEDNDNTIGPVEEYVNSNTFSYGHDTFVSASQPNFKRNQKTETTTRRVDSAALKKVPFIPPAISVELVRRQSKKDPEIERQLQNKKSGGLLPDYENHNSWSLLQAKSLGNLKEMEQQPIYVNNNQVFLKKEKSVDLDIHNNKLMPELPLKQRQKTRALGGQTATWEKGRSLNYENIGGDCVGGSWQGGAVYKINKNKVYFTGQAVSASNLSDGEEYETMLTTKESIPPPKPQQMSAPLRPHAVQSVALLESRRRGAAFTRKENKAVRRSKYNVEALLQPPDVVGQRTACKNDGYSDGHASSVSHHTNTESLMQLLGLPINSSCSSDQVQTLQEDDYLPADDYDDNCS